MGCCGCTGAPWQDLPERYPPYPTCHRRFQRWVHHGILTRILEVLAEDLRARGGLDVSEAFIDASFSSAKKGAPLSVPLGVAVADRHGLPVAVRIASASP